MDTEIAGRLSAPFDAREVKWKPQAVKGNRALAIAYIDARLIMDRLDDVMGVDCWQDEYEILADGSVVCRLRLKLGGEWVTKVDVGSLSEQPDGGDRLKAAFSDALKRAAVKYGIGRYLYRLPHQWVEYDPARKQIVQPPQLPAFALPKPKARDTAARVPGVVVAADASAAEAARLVGLFDGARTRADYRAACNAVIAAVESGAVPKTGHPDVKRAQVAADARLSDHPAAPTPQEVYDLCTQLARVAEDDPDRILADICERCDQPSFAAFTPQQLAGAAAWLRTALLAAAK